MVGVTSGLLSPAKDGGIRQRTWKWTLFTPSLHLVALINVLDD